MRQRVLELNQIYLESKSARKWPLKQEPYDPDARDADSDGVVQEGTAWERPLGTRFVRLNGLEYPKGLQIARRPPNARLVDAEGNAVDYTPTYERPDYTGLGRTIGETSGNVAPPKKPLSEGVRAAEKFKKLVKERKPPKVKAALHSKEDGTELSQADFEKLIEGHIGKKLPENFWDVELSVVDSKGQKIRLKVDRRTNYDPKKDEWENPGREKKIAVSYLLARRMRENGSNPQDLSNRKSLYINKKGDISTTTTNVEGFVGTAGEDFFEISKDDPLFEQLLDEAIVSEMVHEWATSGSMTKSDAQKALQNTVADFFDLDTERYPLKKGSPYSGEKSSQALQGFVEAMYEETQQMFANADITNVKALRGFSFSLDDVSSDDLLNPETFASIIGREYVINGSSEGELTGMPISFRSLSSFTVNQDIAEEFAGENVGHQAVVQTSIPVERILATPGSGIGCLSEGELVVIGAPQGVNDNVNAKYELIGELKNLGQDGAVSKMTFEEVMRPRFNAEAYLATFSPEVRREMRLMYEGSELEEVLFEMWIEEVKAGMQ